MYYKGATTVGNGPWGVTDGIKLQFDAFFFNAEYNETRYYEGPSKGEKPAGSIVLTTPEVVAQK